MLTGCHMVQDVSYKNCNSQLGWICEFATEDSQHYKEGCVILKCALVWENEGFEEHVPFNNSWKKMSSIHLFPGFLHWKQKSAYTHCQLSIRVRFINCVTRGCENLRWNLSFFFKKIFFYFPYNDRVWKEYYVDAINFSLCLHLKAEESVCNSVMGCVKKKIWAIKVERYVLHKIWKEICQEHGFLTWASF